MLENEIISPSKYSKDHQKKPFFHGEGSGEKMVKYH